jgi:glycerophosphoryl diester phosphodiesterase
MGYPRLSFSDADPAHSVVRRKDGITPSVANQINSEPAGQNVGIRLDPLIAWTINDKDDMACLTQMGVSGIITDKIGDLISVAAANNASYV